MKATGFLLARQLLDLKGAMSDLSAATLDGIGHLWLGSDEGLSLERLTRQETCLWGSHRSFDLRQFLDLADNAEIDIEGLDYAGGYLWLVGSHSSRRPRPKSSRDDADNLNRLSRIRVDANRHLLARIPCQAGELHVSYPDPDWRDRNLTTAWLPHDAEGSRLTDYLREDPHLGPFLRSQIPGKENGFDIEGLAVWRDRLFLGLRGPVLRGWAILLELLVEPDERGFLDLRPIGSEGRRYRKYFLDLEGLGIRELCWQGDDLLILAGPTMALDGAIRLYRLRDALDLGSERLLEPRLCFEIPHQRGSDRAEGICLSSGFDPDRRDLLVVYDTPDPSRIQGGVLADLFRL